VSDHPPRVSYKSVRLLCEAIRDEMDKLRKSALTLEGTPDQKADIFDAMGTLRTMFDDLAVKADRMAIDDLAQLPPADYVTTMKPIVSSYHRQLMTADALAPCLCDDLKAVGCVLILIGDGKLIVRTAVDPNRPEAQLAVDALLESLDNSTKQVVAEGAAEVEKQLGVVVPESDLEPKA